MTPGFISLECKEEMIETNEGNQRNGRLERTQPILVDFEGTGMGPQANKCGLPLETAKGTEIDPPVWLPGRKQPC